VAVTPSGDVLLVRQVREAIRTPLLEIPAGTRDVAGEDAETCAIRELLEETGYAGSNTRRLGWIYTSPGVMDERIDLFACQASEAPLEPAVELGVETVRMGFAQAIGAIRSGLIVDAKSITALLLEQGRARRGG
jgi:ADP-ribose pyrophosphatase